MRLKKTHQAPTASATGAASATLSRIGCLAVLSAGVDEVVAGCVSFAFFFFFRSAVQRCIINKFSDIDRKGLPVATALFTFSVSSLLCSRYSVSSKRCFFPARTGSVSAVPVRSGSPDPIAGVREEPEDEGSIPSLRSSASSLAFWASAFAASLSGSDSRYSASLKSMYFDQDGVKRQ